MSHDISLEGEFQNIASLPGKFLLWLLIDNFLNTNSF